MTTTPLDPALEVHIDLSACTDKRDLLDRFAAALRFPSWFGYNWDAMHDCLTDLSWLPASAYRVVLSHPALLRVTHHDGAPHQQHRHHHRLTQAQHILLV